MTLRAFALVAALALMTPAAQAAPSPAESCTPKDDMTPICGVNQPEDVELTPDGKALIVSEMNIAMDDQGALSFKPGRLSLMDLATNGRRDLVPTKDAEKTGRAVWGDPSCATVGAALSPHGLHLSRRTDNKWQLLVVNHGERLSVEFFEVKGKGDRLRLEWRGCVVFPDAAGLNDVAALPKGGFVVTALIFGTDNYGAALKKAKQGLNTGMLLRWRPEVGSDLFALAPLPNGIQIAPDGSALFIAATGEIRKLDPASGAVLGKVAAAAADNFSWGADGRLIVGTGPVLAPGETCENPQLAAPCGSLYKITAIDPKSLATETLLERRSAPIGAVSIAVETKDSYFLGTPMGNNLLKIPATSRKAANGAAP